MLSLDTKRFYDDNRNDPYYDPRRLREVTLRWTDHLPPSRYQISILTVKTMVDNTFRGYRVSPLPPYLRSP